MNLLRGRNVVPVLMAVSLLTFACASPPEAEKKAADAAVSAATAAEAEKYAAGEFSAMTAAVKKAESEMSSKAYKEAKASYVTAKDLADKATTAAAAGKAAAQAAAKAAQAETEKQIADLEGRWKELEGKATAAAKKLKADQKAAWAADAKSVAEAFEAAKAAVATDAAAAKAKLESVPAVLDKWAADLAAAEPAKGAKKPAATK